MLDKYIKKNRKKAGLTQVELAKKLNYNGQFISDWERGISLPPLNKIRKLSKVLSLDIIVVKQILIEEYKEYLEKHIYP